MNDEVRSQIDAAILKWTGTDFRELAKELGISRAQVDDRYEEQFAGPARKMILEGASNEDIRIATGLPNTAIGSFRAHITMQRSKKEVEVAEAVEVSLSLERDLQMALRTKITQLEAGLRIIDNDVEHSIETGRIDIYAEDKKGNKVVIELKLGRADKSAVGQILGYMGELSHKSGTTVRGILVAESFDFKAIYAAKLLPQLQLMEYEMNFAFKKPK